MSKEKSEQDLINDIREEIAAILHEEKMDEFELRAQELRSRAERFKMHKPILDERRFNTDSEAESDSESDFSPSY